MKIMSIADHPISYDPAMRQLLKVKSECQEKRVDPSIQRGIDKALKLMMDRQTYCENISTAPSEVLQQVSRDTWAHPFTEAYRAGKISWDMTPQMLTGILEGNFLQSFISASKANTVLEIGMFTGYSALTMAEAIPENGKVVTCDIEPYLGTMARKYCSRPPHGHKVDIRIGPADETLQTLAKEGQRFDVVYIDADKDGYVGYYKAACPFKNADKDAYVEYYKAIMKMNLLAPGGSILFDNSLFFGSPYMDRQAGTSSGTGNAISRCNEFLRSQNDIHKVLLPVRDGVMIVRRKNETLGRK